MCVVHGQDTGDRALALRGRSQCVCAVWRNHSHERPGSSEHLCKSLTALVWLWYRQGLWGGGGSAEVLGWRCSFSPQT